MSAMNVALQTNNKRFVCDMQAGVSPNKWMEVSCSPTRCVSGDSHPQCDVADAPIHVQERLHRLGRTCCLCWFVNQQDDRGRLGIDGSCTDSGPIRMLLTSPKQFFASNVGKFLMRAIGFMCLVLSFTWLVFQRIDINAPLVGLLVCIFRVELTRYPQQSVEFLIWIIVLGFIVNEISEASRQGVKVAW